MIAAILLLNALFGLLQEERADRALAALRRMAPAEASVIRDSQLRRIEARLLVPGDRRHKGITPHRLICL